jgi:hypothetical protein
MTYIRLYRGIAIALTLNLVVLSLGFAQTYTQDGSKLVGSGTVGKAWQGASVAVSADGNTSSWEERLIMDTSEARGCSLRMPVCAGNKVAKSWAVVSLVCHIRELQLRYQLTVILY